MGQTCVSGDLFVQGQLSTQSFMPPAASIDDTAIKTSPRIQSTKVQQQYQPTYGQPGGAISFTERRVIHVVRGATATLLAFKAGTRTVCTGAATITFDLLKNGTTVLTAVITQNNVQAAYALTAAVLSVSSAVVGDVFEVNIVATSGGGGIGNGCFATLQLQEDPS